MLLTRASNMAGLPKRLKLAVEVSAVPRRALSASVARREAYHFDSAAFVRKLQAAGGCSQAEAAGLLKALETVFKEAGDSIAASTVKQEEHEKSTYQQKVEFTRLKSEVQLAAKQDFGALKAEGDKNLSELETLRQRMKEEVARTIAKVRLDLSFERGRTREDLGARDIRIKEVDGRVDHEVQSIRASNASMKSQSIQYTIGAIVRSLTKRFERTFHHAQGVAVSLFFGYLRLTR